MVARAADRRDLNTIPLQAIEMIQSIGGSTRSSVAEAQNVATQWRRPEGRGRSPSNPTLSANIEKGPAKAPFQCLIGGFEPEEIRKLVRQPTRRVGADAGFAGGDVATISIPNTRARLAAIAAV
jgi:hypothetical protein